MTKRPTTAATRVFGIENTTLWQKLRANADAKLVEKAKALLENRLVIENGKAVVLDRHNEKALTKDELWHFFAIDVEGGVEFLKNLMKKPVYYALAYTILTSANNRGSNPLFIISETPEGAHKAMEYLRQAPQEWSVKMLSCAGVAGELSANGHGAEIMSMIEGFAEEDQHKILGSYNVAWDLSNRGFRNRVKAILDTTTGKFAPGF